MSITDKKLRQEASVNRFITGMTCAHLAELRSAYTLDPHGATR
jgi:hypothetical protein